MNMLRHNMHLISSQNPMHFYSFLVLRTSGSLINTTMLLLLPRPFVLYEKEDSFALFRNFYIRQLHTLSPVSKVSCAHHDSNIHLYMSQWPRAAT